MRVLPLLLLTLAVSFCVIETKVPKLYVTIPKNTLKRLKFTSQSSIMAKLGSLGVAASRLSIVAGIGMIAYDIVQSEKERNELSEKLDVISQKIDDISTQIYNMENFIANTQEGAVLELKKDKFIQVLSKMTADENRLLNMIASYSTNETALLPKIENFIDEYEKQDYESQLADFLFMEFTGSKSFAMEMLKLFRKYQSDMRGPSGIKASTQKILHDISFFILTKIVHSFEVLELAMKLKFKLTGSENQEDKNYLELNRNLVLQSFDISQRRLLNSFNDKGDLEELLSLENNLDDFVSFQSVFQNYLVREEEASLQNRCDRKCQDYTNQTFSDEHCQGTLRDCVQDQTWIDYVKTGGGAVANSFLFLKNKIFSSSQTEYVQNDYQSSSFVLSNRDGRIYERYNYANEGWRGTNLGSGEEVTLHPSNRLYDDCDICKCTCDQYDNNSTVRKFYLGKFSAPDEYVITSFRFYEQQKTIFLQPQVGKILPMGFIDTNTLTWLNIPAASTEEEFAYVKYGDSLSRRINLGDKSSQFNDTQVVTGVQLTYEMTTGIALKLYGKTLESFEDGILGSIEYMAPNKNSYRQLGIGNRPGLKSKDRSFTVSQDVWLEFRKSDEETDAGQTLVPYFDPISATFDPPAPLSMVNLIHYTNNGDHAGFIRPFVKSMDYKKFIGK